MPNGRPGDDPFTDIVVHRLEVFGPAVDALIQEIGALGGRAEMKRRFDLHRLDPRFPSGGSQHDVAVLEDGLTQLRDELRNGRSGGEG